MAIKSINITIELEDSCNLPTFLNDVQSFLTEKYGDAEITFGNLQKKKTHVKTSQ